MPWAAHPRVVAWTGRFGVPSTAQVHGRDTADDPRASPLFGAVEMLPPVLIQVGSDEILLDEPGIAPAPDLCPSENR